MSRPDPGCPVPPVTVPEPEKLLAVTARTFSNMGDHGEYVTHPVAYIAGETVEELVERAFPGLVTSYGRHDIGDRLEIQVVPAPDAPAGSEFHHWKPAAVKAAEQWPPF